MFRYNLLKRNITSYSLVHTIKDFSKKQPKPIKLNNLLEHANIRNNHQTIVRTQYLYNELPIRLSQRIMELNELPYNLLKMPSIQKVYNLYIDTFRRIIEIKYPNNIDDSNNYSLLLSKLKDEHKDINHYIANALITYKKRNKINIEHEIMINDILDRFYTSRLSIRFLTQQHLELQKNNNNFIGIINEKVNPYDIIYNTIMDINQMSSIIYNKEPIIELDKDSDKNIELVYIDSHINYILIEILKNAVRATMENKLYYNPISILIKKGEQDLIIKISDTGGGFDRKNIKKLFNFTYTTADINDYINVNNNNSIISGYGHGLGLSRIYARYFGGDLIITTVEGVGTDVYIYLNRLGNSNENVSDYKF